jgi:large subunit ribosomal protein L53
MITRFLTDVRVAFNPFSPRSKPARLFLSLIPPNARQDGMKIESKMLPRESKEPASLAVKFSTYTFRSFESCIWSKR